MNGGLSMVEMKSGYKMTEVGVIPEDWEVKELSSISEIKSGKRLPKGSLVTSSKTPYPYIRVIDMNMGYLNLSDIMYVPENVQPMISKYIISKNDIYISVAGTLGLVGKIPEELDGANLTENANRITEIQCNRDYLMYYMMSPLIQNVIEAERTIGAQPKLALQRIRDFYIVLPGDNREQTAIAAALSDADSLISALTKKIEKKKAIKQGLMQQLLTGKKRLPGFCGDWIKKKVSSVSDILRGGSPRPIENYIVKSGGVNWIKIGDVDSSAKYIFRTNEQIIESGIQYSRFVHSGDLLLSNSMSFGRPYILKTEGCIHDGWLVIQNYDKYFDKEFLYYLLGSDEVLKQYKSLAAGSSVLNLNKDIVGKVVLYFPPSISEQTAIANILSDCDSEIAALEEKRDKYKEIKQGMMQQLLTGKIRLI